MNFLSCLLLSDFSWRFLWVSFATHSTLCRSNWSAPPFWLILCLPNFGRSNSSLISFIIWQIGICLPLFLKSLYLAASGDGNQIRKVLDIIVALNFFLALCSLRCNHSHRLILELT
jgi:hypothetical protein